MSNSAIGKLRHVVLFKFKDGTTPAKIKEIEDAFGALKDKIDSVVDYEWGTNNSDEGLTLGYTHCFLVTFDDKAGRAEYLPHPEHEKFKTLVGPHLDAVHVIDYFAKP